MEESRVFFHRHGILFDEGKKRETDGTKSNCDRRSSEFKSKSSFDM